MHGNSIIPLEIFDSATLMTFYCNMSQYYEIGVHKCIHLHKIKSHKTGGMKYLALPLHYLQVQIFEGSNHNMHPHYVHCGPKTTF